MDPRTGWDDAFDKKFESADNQSAPVSVVPTDPFDPFAGTGAGLLPGAAQEGFGGDTFSGKKDVPKSFGDDKNNPFLEKGNYSYINLCH